MAAPKANALNPTTQRAYTLRLRGTDVNDHSWCDALWATHKAVNKGAKVFGDWLLTLRGGLCHTLADAKASQGKGKSDRDGKRRDRRILLALSWLSVESAPTDRDPYKAFVIASGKEDSQSSRNAKVVRTLQEVLKKRGVKNTDIDDWITDCEPSLSAAIRDDAVWVNRSDVFDAARHRVGDSLNRDEVWDLLEPFFGSPDAYLASLTVAEDSDSAAATEEKAKDLVQKAGQWLSSRFGTGKGANFAQMSKVYDAIAAWVPVTQTFSNGSEALASLVKSLAVLHPTTNDADGILTLISGPGYKSATRNIIKAWQAKNSQVTEQDITKLSDSVKDDSAKCHHNTGGKGHRPWSDMVLKEVEAACGFTYIQASGSARHSEFAVMLDHAARRVSIGHSWIKRAESERQKFKADAGRIQAVPTETQVWLDQFCQERSGSSGAIDVYRIRKRAVEGWKEVVAKWGCPVCKTAEDRVAAAREMQANPDIDKFGDIQLFEAIAEDDAVCVWQVNGKADAQPLFDYVAAKDAQAKQQRFKVPAYRHPDPLAHPVFCDFGNSRWNITFAVHAAASKMNGARQTLSRRDTELIKSQERLVKSNTSEKRTKAQAQLEQARKDLDEAKEYLAWLSSGHAIAMGLWDGQKLDDSLPLRWSCKRLAADMALRQDANNPTDRVAVTRADRLGRAAAGAKPDSAIDILGVFDEDHWNGRLQAPRAQLDAIAQYVAKHGWDAKARQMRSRIRWLVSFSAKLQPAGPWIEYARKTGLRLDQRNDELVIAPRNSRDEWRGLAYPFWHPSNENGRKGLAKHLLSCLPGLRVLSVDLGHRYAAACAVWETLTIQQMNDTCKAAGHALPAESDMFLHLATIGADGRPRTTIYRRIGADHVEDIDQNTGEVRQAPHPAPWARLERQFLIKLPGEDHPARKASPAELDTIRRLEESLGRKRPTDDSLPCQIDELLSTSVDTARLALRRHGDAARIAYAFKPGAEKLTPGGGRVSASTEDRQSMILDALVRWHGLSSGDRWTDSWAVGQWDVYIKPLLVTDLPLWTEDSGESRRQYCGEIEELLKPVAEKLAKGDTSAFHRLWTDQWRFSDAAWRGKNGHLRVLRSLILRRGVSAEKPSAWNVGGLSLTRIATLKLLYQVQKAYHMRPEPQDPRKNIPVKGEDELRDFGRRILDAMERMREQRVKQLASRIAEAALGIGRMKPAEGPRDIQRPRQHVDDPCHAIVIENLTNYRPEETRTRRENHQLMSWSSSKVKKYLSEACQLHGLYLREVQAGYTSRQDSRTGAPGIRCSDIAVTDFMIKPWWRRQVNIAKEKVKQGKCGAREQYLADLDAKWATAGEAQRRATTPLRIPVNGGELFVSAAPCSPAAKGLQADLNAAANIGLKALLDPDWPGKWWYIPCSTKDGKPSQDKVKGAVCVSLQEKFCEPAGESAGKKHGEAKKKEIVNVWRDPSTASMDGSWDRTAFYWNKVYSRVVDVLRLANGLTTSAKNAVESKEVPW
jgi:IS605 OrfB family transposase